jgi:predicted nucleotidyltransferase
VDIGEDLVVPVVTLPAFVLLKLFAWKDRRLLKNTDAGDILFVLRNYFPARRQRYRHCSRRQRTLKGCGRP